MPIIQAFIEGKKILVKDKRLSDEEDNWLEVSDCSFNIKQLDYRIKPEPKYRSFKNAEECWNEMQKHQPFGYTYDRFNNIRDSITKVATTGVSYDSPTVISFEEIFDRFVFADGIPFGVKVEE